MLMSPVGDVSVKAGAQVVLHNVVWLKDNLGFFFDLKSARSP
jgi:hypothetical protein